MAYVLPILGMIGSFCLIRYREQVGDMLGEAQWMKHVGGVYNVVFLLAVFLFFWCLASLTGTTTFLFRPLLWLFPVSRSGHDVL